MKKGRGSQHLREGGRTLGPGMLEGMMANEGFLVSLMAYLNAWATVTCPQVIIKVFETG
jgi:hypothetical protein